MKKILLMLITSTKVAFMQLLLSLVILLISIIIAYRTKRWDDMIGLVLSIIFLIIYSIAFIHYWLAYNGKIKSNWNVKPDMRKKLLIVSRGIALLFLLITLMEAAYVKFQSDLICIVILLATVTILIIFFCLNFKYYNKIE